MNHLKLLLLLLLSTTTLVGQDDEPTGKRPRAYRFTDSVSATQLSYGLNLYLPVFQGTAYGATIDVEGRFRRNFSYLATLGMQFESSGGLWGTVPLDTLGLSPPPDWPRQRLVTGISEDRRWTYLGGGGQANLRIGAGDLSLGVLVTVGVDQLRQFVPFGSLILPTTIDPPDPNTVGAPRGLFGTATIDYQPLVRLGGRLQLHYTRWFTRRVALRLGVAIDGQGPVIVGSYIDRSPERNRYRVRKVTYSPNFRPGVDNYGLPTEDFFRTPDPTYRRADFLWNFGVIYKPSKNLPGE